jgi:WXG100 family type VII secretion target
MVMKSTDPEGQNQAAGTFNDYATDFQNRITALKGEVDGMQYTGTAADQFRNTHNQWHEQTQTVVNRLNDMADRLRGTSTNQINAESDNTQYANYFKTA